MIYDYKCNRSKEVVQKSHTPEETGNHDCLCGGQLSRYFRPGSITIHTSFNEEILDHSTGDMIKVSDIDRIGKEQGKIWLGHEEAKRIAKENKVRNDRISKEKSEKSLESKLLKIL